MAFAPDGRLFVTEQDGDVRVVTREGQLLPQPFAHVDVRNDGEQGLIGLAFDPNFAQTGNLYLHYATPNALNRVSRVTADPSNPNVATASSLTEILTLPRDDTFGYNHQGGALNFGADGKLYWTSGEHNNPSYAQNLESPYGKILRLNPDGSFPSDNPFYSASTGWGRAVWALGLRNPYTFAIEPGTGRMLINDVGGGLREEVNLGRAGANYGWPATEGEFNPAQYPTFTNPVHDYERGIVGCAIIGAAFYNPPAGATNPFPASYTGKYFFSDYCSRFIHMLDPENGYAPSVFGTDNQLPDEAVDLEVGPDGSLYGLARGAGGVVLKISYTGSNAPVIGTHPRSQTGTVGQSITFDVSVSGAPPFNYQWQRKNAGAAAFANIAGATSSSYSLTVTQADDQAQFRVVVTNGSGSATSNPATLSATSNRPPSATIVLPAAGALYSGGQTIEFAGQASDPEDGSLPSSAYTWSVAFHHDTHTHPAVAPFSGSAFGNFVVPTIGETAANVWYRIHLVVEDSQGLTTEVTRDVHPRTSQITLATQPAGLSVTLDGAATTTPRTLTGVVGINRQIGAPAAQTLNGVTYEFVSWSDGGAAEHFIPTPAADTTYTAVYRPITLVMGRHIFYNNSSFDGRSPDANAADDSAVATDKQALLPGQTATFANYTSYASGINGIMIDLANGGAPVSEANFTFRVGNNSNPATWAVAPAPAVTRRNGAGTAESDRITLTWPDRLIRNKWIEVTFRVAPGEPPRDVFFFGNAVGETGSNPANAYVNALDQANVRSRLRTMAGDVSNQFDFNRDGRVNVVDQRIVRNNLASGMRALALIAPGTSAADEQSTAAAAQEAPRSAALLSTRAIKPAQVGITSIVFGA